MTDLVLPAAAIPDGGARTLAGPDPAEPGVIVVRSAQDLSAFRNDCPHAHLPLDLIPGRVLTRDRRHLLCANHGARFRLTDGLCIHGPCRGRHLARLGVARTGNAVRIRLDPRARAVVRRPS